MYVFLYNCVPILFTFTFIVRLLCDEKRKRSDGKRVNQLLQLHYGDSAQRDWTPYMRCAEEDGGHILQWTLQKGVQCIRFDAEDLLNMLHELLLALSGHSGGVFVHKEFGGLKVCVYN